MGEDHTCRQAYRNLQVAIKKRKKRYTLTQKKTHDAMRERKKNHKAALYTKQDPVFLKYSMCVYVYVFLQLSTKKPTKIYPNYLQAVGLGKRKKKKTYIPYITLYCQIF